VEKKTETRVREFYDEKGWQVDQQGVELDTQLWDLGRDCSAAYDEANEKKVFNQLTFPGEFFLDAGSGPARRDDYVEYYNFRRRVCVDFSHTALTLARTRHGNACQYVLSSLVNLPFPDDFFDSAISLHVIYHIDKADQERAVREIIRVTKPGKPIIIIYRNPLAPFDIFQTLLRSLRVNKLLGGGEVYFYTHPLWWWKRFTDSCQLKIFPWNVLNVRAARCLIPDNNLGKSIFKWVAAVERDHPRLAAALWSYPLIVLTKKPR
jgi:ubiquinone/menaquinone biosynthesis C-methylase UbiE